MAGQTARTCGPGHRAAMASSQCPRSDAQHFLFHGCHPQGGQLALCNQTGCATSSTRPSIENDARWAGVSTGPVRTGLLAGARQTRYSAVGNGPWLAKMWMWHKGRQRTTRKLGDFASRRKPFFAAELCGCNSCLLACVPACRALMHREGGSCRNPRQVLLPARVVGTKYSYSIPWTVLVLCSERWGRWNESPLPASFYQR